MMDEITKQINTFLSTLTTIYNQQGQLGRILLPGLAFLIVCCLCSLSVGLLSARSRNPSPVAPGPSPFPTAGIEPSPTPLFNFPFPTFTPFPTSTSFIPSPFPTGTPAPTGTVTSTSTPGPTATATLLPTQTATQVPPTTGRRPTIRIIDVDKRAEYADIENLTNATINLRGWRLVSEAGNQSCELRGNLGPNRVLRIWAHQGDPGFDCRFRENIWRDNQPDPAVLYNPQGEEISRFPS